MIVEYATYSMQQGGDLVSLHLPLVKRIANHLAVKLPPHIEIDDLIQVGLIGLLKAKEDYQADSGATFSTYATIRIRGAMMDELRARDWLPRSVQKNLGRVATAMRGAEQRLGRAPTDSEVASELGVSLNEYQEILGDVSFARLTPVEDIDTVAGDMEPDREVTESLRATALSDAIKELPEKEQLMMSMYYVDNLNLKEIGLVLEVSESRVSQIHGQAIARLKSKLQDWT
jgi:RNA polymerase sigma factor for flagellar operon FliA